MKISTQFKLLTVFAAGLSFVIAAAVFLLHSLAVLTDADIANRDNQVAVRAQQFVVTVRGLKQYAETLANDPDVVDWVSGRYETASQTVLKHRIEKSFVNILRHQTQYYQLRILDRSGFEKIRVNKNGSDLSVVKPESLQDKSQRDYFLMARNRVSHAVSLSAITLNEEFGEIASPEVVTLRAIAPILADGKRKGYLVVNVDVSSFLNLLVATQGDEVAFVINRSGEFIAHPKREWTFATQRGTHYGLAQEYPEIQNWLASTTHENWSGGADKHIGPWVAAARAIDVIPTELDSRSFVVQLLPRQQLVRKVTERMTEQLLWAALWCGIGVLFAAWLGGLFSKRVLVLKSLAQRLARGARVLDMPEKKRDEVDEVASAFAYLLDCIKTQENELKAQAERLDAVLNTVMTGVITIDDKGIIVEVNEHLARLFGYSPHSMVGKNVAILMEDDLAAQHDRFLQLVDDSKGSRIIGQSREFVARKKDGSYFPIQLTVNRLQREGKNYYVGAIEDISLKVAQDNALRDYALRLERSNEELEGFAYVASHDLQEPVQKIQALVELLERQEKDVLSAQGVETMRRCRQSAQKMRQLIQALLNLSRVRQSREDMKDVDVAMLSQEVIEEMAPVLEAQKGTVVVEPLPKVRAAPVLLRQLLCNLFNNAIKYATPGVPPRVVVKPFQPIASLKLKNRRLIDSGVAIAVEDNGCGIPKAEHQSVFMPFHRLHKEEDVVGSGIGLSLVKKIMESGGGEVLIDPHYRDGTRFVLVFASPALVEALRSVKSQLQA